MRPIFETPRLDDLEPTEGAQRGFFGSVAAGWEAQRSFDNFNSEAFLRDRVWRDYIDEIELRSGDRLPHPDDFIPEIDLPIMLGASDEDGGGVAGAKARFVLARIEELRDQNPELNIPGPEWMAERLMAEADRVEVEESRSGGAGLFFGRLGAAFTDPATIVTAPVGGGQKTVLRAAGVEAAVNGLLEMANIPVANRWREELGVDTMTLEEGAQSVAIAMVAGGILGGAGRFAETELPRAFNRLSNSRLAAALRDLSGGNPERLELAEALAREAEVEGQNPFPPSGADLHEARLQDAMTAITETDAARAGAAMERLLEDVPPPAAGSAALPSGLTEIDPRTLEVDAARFQFKDGGDSEGVTDRLAGVSEWDPVRAGISLVFEQEDGARFIVDGRQRRGLAARLLEEDPDANIRLTAFVYREADGWADAEIRAIAAAKNLAEGTGTAIDAAKILRADPDLLDGSLPTRGALIRDAQGLMRLGDDAFGAVVNDVVPANFAAIVGRIIEDPAEQVAAIEAEALVRGAQAAGFARREGETGSLFGDIPTESLIADRARILSRAISILRKEKGVFTTLAREADRIENAGNRLARDANQERASTDAALLEILQTLAHRAGPVADALNARVRDANGNFAAGARAFVGDIRDLTASGDLSRLLDGGSRRDVDPAASGERGGDAPLGAEPAPPENRQARPGQPVRLQAFPRQEHKALELEFISSQADRVSVDALLDGADGLRLELGSLIDRALPDGVEMVLGPVKAADRIVQKIEDKGYAGAGRLTDVVRAAVLPRSVEEADVFVDGLAAIAPVFDEGVALRPGGYVDRKVLVRLADGRVAEIQLTSPQMWSAKRDRGDAAYHDFRVSEPGSDARRVAQAKMEEIFAGALAASDQSWVGGIAGRPGNAASNSPRDISSPDIAQMAGSRASQAPDASENTNPARGDTSTAGVRSQSINRMGDTSASDIGDEFPLDNPETEEFQTGLIFEAGEGPRRETVTAADVEAEIAADDAAVERLRGCVPR